MTDDVNPATLKRIERAIRNLPRRQREVFCAVRFDDLSYIEIAERTGLTVEHVERLLALALCSVSRHVDRAACRRWWQRR